MEIRRQLHAPANLPPGRGEGRPVPNEQEVQWALEPVWVFGEEEHLLSLTESELRIFQPVG